MLNTGIILLTQTSRIKYDNDTIFLNLTICKEFDYDISKVQFIEKFNYSIIAENNLECSIKSKVYMMFPYLGCLIGGFLFVILPQKFTHKSLVYVGISGSIFSLYLGGYKNQPFLTFLMMLISSINSTIVCLASYTQGIEVVVKEKRALYGSIVFSGALVSESFYCWFLMVKLNMNWSGIFGICIVINGVIEIIYYFWTFESPRRLLKHKRFVDAFDTINAIARFNGTYEEVDKQIRMFNIFKEFIEKERSQNDKTIFILQNKAPLFEGIKALFNKSIRKDFLLLSGIWFCSNCIYSNITSFFKIEYENYTFYFLMLFLTEIVSVIIIYLLVQIKSIGRKKTLIILFFTYSSSLLINYFFSLYSYRVTEILFGFISHLFFCGSEQRTILLHN